MENRKILNGRRSYDGTCLAHAATCKEIDNVRGLFKWGFGLIISVAIAVGVVGINVFVTFGDRMHESIESVENSLKTLEGDVKVIKYRIEQRGYDGRQSESNSENKVRFPG